MKPEQPASNPALDGEHQQLLEQCCSHGLDQSTARQVLRFPGPLTKTSQQKSRDHQD